MSLKIKFVKGHYEAFVNGRFVVSGDTYSEIIRELEEMRYLE